MLPKEYFPFVLAALLLLGGNLFAQTTAFTYQGRLLDGGAPAAGQYDLRFELRDAATAGSAVGSAQTTNNITVTNGIFTATLDFGAGVFPGAGRWLEISVRTNGGPGFTILTPRQEITSAPYAVQALTAANLSGTLAAGNLTGTIPDARLSANVPLLSSSATFGSTVAATAFSGSGNSLTNLNPAAIGSPGTVSQLPISLLTSISAPVGVQPYGVVAADVNGDGRVDLISVNQGGNTLTVLTNNGGGGFAFAVTLPVGTAPQSVAAADLNGDGRIDLVSANYTSSTLTVLTNNGTGGFITSTNISVGTNPSFVIAADVNNDGKMDLVSANYSAGTLTVLINNGAGVFSPSAAIPIGLLPTCVVAADVNGDGKVDLISASKLNNTLIVLTNNGAGGFVAASTNSVGIGPISLVAADVNGDGHPDLICANYSGLTMNVLTNNGSGGFVTMTNLSFGTGPRSVAALDINGDGRIDLITANYDTSTITLLTNSASGFFSIATNITVGANPIQIIATDTDGDGRAEIITANFGNNTCSILANRTGALKVQVNELNWLGASLSPDQGGSVELGSSFLNGTAPYIDFHFGKGSAQDFNVRLANDADGRLSLTGNLAVSGTISGIGSGLTALPAASLTGSISDARLSANVPLLTGGKLADSVHSANVPLLSAGKLPDSVHSANVALLNGGQTYSGAVTLSNLANAISGNGSGLTALNASSIATGTLGDARLSANVPLLSSGKLADAFHSTNVALLTSNLTFSGNIGMGLAQSTLARLTLASSAAQFGLHVTDGNNGNIVLQTLDASESGLQSITFNGYSDSNNTDHLFNPLKNRWRMSVDQRGNSDVLEIEVHNGTTPLTILSLSPDGNLTTAGTVNGGSDRNIKAGFAAVDPREVLAEVATLPIQSWRYTNDPVNVRHLGPVAQDFHAAFGVGADDKHISMVDADGVALAAIQGLNATLTEQRAALEAKEERIRSLESRLADLERLVRSLSTPVKGEAK